MLRLLRNVPWWGQLAWVALILGVTIRLVTTRTPTHGSVVPIYLNAAQRWLVESDLYAYALPLDNYRNPPIVATVFIPFSMLPARFAEVSWRMLNLVAFALGLLAFVQRFYPTLTRLQYGFLVSSVAFLILPSFNNGQMNLLIAACCVWAITLVDRREWWLAAGWLTLATLLKTYPLALGMLLALRSPQLIPRLVICLLLMLLAPFGFGRFDYVWGMYERFLEFTQFEQAYRHLIRRMYWDWSIIPTAWFGVIVPLTITKVVSAMAAVACAVRVWYQPSPLVVLMIATTWMTLFGPATEASTYTLMAPAVGLLLVTTVWRHSPVLYMLTWLAYGAHLQPILRGIFPTSDFWRGQSAQAIGTILLLIRLRFESPTLATRTVTRSSIRFRRWFGHSNHAAAR